MGWIQGPLVVTIELTNECNLKCRHCYASAGEKLDNELSLDEIKQLLGELSQLGTMEVEFSGGEPLLRPDLFEIIEYAEGLDFSVVLITNGTLVDREVASTLGSLGLKHVQVSLDGLKENHDYLRGDGTYEAVLESVRLLAEEGVSVAVRTTVNRRNVGELEKIADLAVGMGASKLGFVRFFPAGRGMGYKEDLMLDAEGMRSFRLTGKKIKEKYRDKIEISADPCGFLEEEIFQQYLQEESILCPCGKTWCLVKPDGTVSPCEIMTFNAGNVRKQRFETIWEGAPIMKAFREFNPELLKGVCSTCRYKKVCAGYCRALAVLHTGDFYAEDFTCYHVLKAREEREAVK
ncbi:MAG: radical SAM protein [Syntrophothermus sp.]|uniref:radical SAM/SPASM domain-containing protein n=1 Tax=Syntrophothermus sp. TaxID=2736299 RepID=UPI00257BC517|nr:radical SAM protein [Syntrophothermus sp.]NSW84310.1 radical SAM protein [Syntrophothermus sp.]